VDNIKMDLRWVVWARLIWLRKGSGGRLLFHKTLFSS
jgi:hypothetical protein